MDRQESVDIYHVDSLSTGEERAFRDKVRKLVDDYMHTLIIGQDLTGIPAFF